MKKRVFATLLVLILCFCATTPVAAAEEKMPCVLDFAQLLTASETAELTEKLESITDEFSVELVIVTVESCGGKSHKEYANMMYDQYVGADKDGVLLLVDMDAKNRGWYICGNGLGADAVDNDEIEEIGEEITPYLKDAEYYDAFVTFAEECETRIDIEINGEPFEPVITLVISLVIGLVIALIVTGIMKGQLKSVHSQRAAANYIRPGSMNVTESRDFYLYSHVTRQKKPEPSSSRSGGSSGGSRRSGGGGSF